MEYLILITLTLLIVKHYICDFPIKIQTPWMFLNKGKYGHPGGIAHAWIHIIGSAIILLPMALAGVFFAEGDFTSGAVLVWKVAAILGIEVLVHYHMDWFKIWLNTCRGYKPDTHPEFWAWLGRDQLVHYLNYVGTTYIMMVWVWS